MTTSTLLEVSTRDRNDTNECPSRADDAVGAVAVVVVGNGGRSDRGWPQSLVQRGGDGGIRLHAREADAGEQDLVMAWRGGEDNGADVGSLDEVVVVADDGDDGWGSDLCEGWRQTAPVEVVARSFLFSFSLK